MYANAIDLVGGYTRPILYISRNYNESLVMPGAGTLFFVNDEGCAVTCKHVVKLFIAAKTENEKYAQFRQKRAALPQDKKRKNLLYALEKEYGYQKGTTVNMKYKFVDCVSPLKEFSFHMHKEHDLAIIQFKGYEKLHYRGHAVFAKDGNEARPGRFFCRLGFPFPEFTNFKYNEQADDIEWSQEGILATPRFPIEGMMTRQLAEEGGKIMGIEMSTPGLKGQSGGPLFDAEGKVYGMQFATKHLHLGFDMKNHQMKINGREQTIDNQPFLHVGHCIHMNVMKAFLQEHNIRYTEA